MEKNKFSIRYSNIGIVCFLILLSLIVSITPFFLNKEKLGKEENIYAYSDKIRFEIYDSLYTSYDRGDLRQDNNVLEYYIRSYKISNYPFTKEYKEKYPNNIVERKSNGSFVDWDGSISEIRRDIDSLSELNIDKTEEPEFTVNYLTSEPNINEFDPQNIKTDENDKIFVSGFYENGKVKFTDSSNFKDKDSNIYLSKLKYEIKKRYSDIEPKSGIKKINFNYMIDLSSNNFEMLKTRMNYETYFFPILLISMFSAFLIVLFLTSISNYKFTSNVGFYKGISSYPIEIVIALIGLWFVPLSFISSEKEYFFKLYNGMLFNIIFFILTFFGSIAIYYIIYSIKDIYNLGTETFVLKNSIIVRFYKFIKKSFIKYFDVSNSRIELILYIGFLILGFFGAIILVRDSLFILALFIWFIFVSGIFMMIRSSFIDLQNISNISKKIADGNYNIKIDEGATRFKSISHSLNSISNNLNTAVENAIQSERLKTELITNVSHDLKTPLTSIINYSQLIVEDNTTNEDRIEYAKIINEKSNKLKKLIEDLFEVSKLSSKNIELNMENVDFKQLIEQVIGEWEDKFNDNNLDININFPDDPVILKLDGNKTSRILDNLFSNINKYALENTRIYVDLTKSEKVKLVIKNISKYPLNITANELIERFTRGDSSRSTEGSGLGLSIASSLTSAQNGNFNIEIDGDLYKTIIEF
ncbi:MULTISPECIES: HAMP domain-containing sensor histidine kinase [Peptoniphilus]|uniref:HAMP domain-containing sensor histidine kinase n=1 Tax=Peptoniphilus TaxID=162289 RepID=UPI0001DA9B59|nr:MULTISPECIES: HAMP domain-containing sensor histidine kinase [Peptoniphilus]EFI42338.1 histidine kinase A domain protein [Peptoniphilus sp. oral taxon 386 str. F0131]